MFINNGRHHFQNWTIGVEKKMTPHLTWAMSKKDNTRENLYIYKDRNALVCFFVLLLALLIISDGGIEHSSLWIKLSSQNTWPPRDFYMQTFADTIVSVQWTVEQVWNSVWYQKQDNWSYALNQAFCGPPSSIPELCTWPGPSERESAMPTDTKIWVSNVISFLVMESGDLQRKQMLG